MLIPLQGDQAENAPFPPNSKVTILRKPSVDTGVQEALYDQVWASGVVIGALLEVNGPHSCQIISKVKVTNNTSDGSGGCGNNNQEKELNCTSSQLRLSVGCSVLVTKNSSNAENTEETCKKCHGIVLGTVDVPLAMRKSVNHTFWYSIYFPSNGLIQHEVVPERVTHQSNVTDNDVDKASSNNPNIQNNVNKQVNGQNKEHDPMPVQIVSNDETITSSESNEKSKELDVPKQEEQNKSQEDEVMVVKTEPIDDIPSSNINEKKHQSSSTQQQKDIEKESSVEMTRERLKHIANKNWGYELFVGNIPSHSMTENELATILSVYGKIAGIRLMKGCAKVMFDNESSCEACIADLHNQVVFPSHSRWLPMRVLPINENDNEFKVYVTGFLNPDIQKDEVRSIFERFGEVKKVYLVRNLQNIPQGKAMVVFHELQSVIDAVAEYSMNDDLKVYLPDRKSHERHLRMFRERSNKSFGRSDFTAIKRKRSEEDHYQNSAKSTRVSLTDESSSTFQSTSHSTIDERNRYVAKVYFPISRKSVIGCIIGNNGDNHKALLKCTNCRITAIQDEDIEHAVEITADSFKKLEEGAKCVLQHLIVGLDHFLNEDLRRKCYFEFVDIHEHSPRNQREDVPPVNQITTNRWSPTTKGYSPPKAAPHKFVGNPNDYHWRVILPLPRDALKDFIIGAHGRRHKELLNILQCKMITLRQGSDEYTTHIEVFDQGSTTAQLAAERLLNMIRVQFGEEVLTANLIKMK